jgi:hypothetical protein
MGILPDRLVGDDNLRPVLDLVRNGLKLGGNHLDSLVCLALLQALAAAQNDTKAAIDSRLGLACNKGIVFLEDDSPLRVADESPGDAALLQLLSGDFASESSVGLVEDVLSGNFDILAEVLACEKEVERWRGDDNLCAGISILSAQSTLAVRVRTGVLINLSLVEVIDNICDGLDRPIPLFSVRPAVRVAVTYSSTRYVHLEVPSDEELTTHVDGLCR